MAGTEIDELSLKISVQGATPTQTKNINAFAQSLEKLDKALPTSLINKLDKLSKLSISMRSIQQAQNLGGKTSTGGFGAIPQLKEQKAQTKQFTEYLEKLEKSKATIKDISKLYQNQPQLNLGGKDKFIQMYGKNHKEREEHAEKQVSEHPLSMGDQAQTKIDALVKRRENIAKLGNTINSKVLSPLKKFGRRFGYIGSLMIISRIVISIMKLLQQGIRNLGQVDKSANKTMSRLQTALTNITNSVSMIFMPMLEIITPLVEQIAQAFANVANFISESVAQMKGLSKYTKISADYMAEYQANAGGRASFDTFNALSSSAYDMFDEEKVGDVTDKMSQLQECIASIKGLVTSIFEMIKPIFTLIVNIISYLTPAFTSIFSILTRIFDVVGKALNQVVELIDPIIKPILNVLIPALFDMVDANLKPIMDVLSFILDCLNPIIELVKGVLAPIIENISYSMQFIAEVMNGIFKGDWSGLGKAFKNMLISVANMAIGIFEGIINSVISTINIITGTLSKLWTWAFGEDSRIPEITWRANWKIPYLANGGMVNAGSMFVAGERGAELVTNLGSGQTGVMNIAQFTEAVVNGINQSGVIEAIKEGGNIYLDNERVGTKVGNSKGLREALNRTNPTLDLK